MNPYSPSNSASVRPAIDVAAIPLELRERDQWVTWKCVLRKGKANKLPFNARTGAAASTTDSSTWSSFAVAMAAFRADASLAGVGFVFSADDPFCGIDLDGCIRDGQLTPEAQAIISEFSTYSEISPSGTGVKMFIRGNKAAIPSCCCKRVAGLKQIEVYDRARFFVVTSRTLPDVSARVESRQAQLDTLCRRLWPTPNTKAVGRPADTSSGAVVSDRVKRCSAYVSKLPDAISGSGGHNATLRAACECFRFGLSEAEAWDVLSQFNSTKTGGEPWTDAELRHKLISAKEKVETEGEVGVRVVQLVATVEPWKPTRKLDETVEQSVVSQSAGGSSAELEVVRLSDVNPTIQKYLWPGRIPSETVSLIGGQQGQTKNLFAYDMAARVTTGTPWPDAPNDDRRPPRSVILLEAEEHLESSIVPRLLAANADLTRVHFVKGMPTENTDRSRLISIQRDADTIERLARRLGDVALVIISPITSYLGSVEQNNNEQVRNEIIHPLKSLTESVRCAVVLLKHPNKDWKNTDPLTRIGGSAAWTEAMRCVIFVGTDPSEPSDERNPRRTAFWIKFSIGPQPDPLSWKIRVVESGAPTIQYVSGPVDYSATEMLAGRRRGDGRGTKRENATEWIMQALESGPATAVGLTDAAIAAINQDKTRRFSRDAFERARKDLRDEGRLRYERKPGSGPAEWWYWLPDGPAPDWYVAGDSLAPTSADPWCARVDPHTCGSCGS